MHTLELLSNDFYGLDMYNFLILNKTYHWLRPKDAGCYAERCGKKLSEREAKTKKLLYL